MKLSEIVEEDQHRVQQVDLEDAVEMIQRDCKECIAAYRSSGEGLIRGVKEMRHSSALALKGRIRTDRIPLHMPEELHNLFSDAADELGIPSRRNSLFCTTDYILSSTWGETYLIFFRDGWKGLVFEKVKNDYVFNRLYRREDELASTKDAAAKMTLAKKILQDLEPKVFEERSGLEEVLRYGYGDVLVSGDAYYGIKTMHNSSKQNDIVANAYRKLGLDSFLKRK